jgi:PAS domain S-box-containing protein
MQENDLFNRIRHSLQSRYNWLPLLLGILSAAGLYAIGRYNFLVFHCLAEAFSIVIAIAVFAIFWNTRQFLDNSVYLVVGFGCLFAGLLDLVYVFAYPGMSVFPGTDGNVALQAKTVAQWYVSLSCVCAFPFLRRKVNQNFALLLYSAVLAIALASIFYWRVFPACLDDAMRITPFERIGLVVSCSAYLGALVLLISNRHDFDSYVFKLLAATLVVFFVQDSACAVALELNGFARTVAHLCQIVALYFVYKAFVEVGLTKPYDLLFRSLRQSEEALERQQQFLEGVLDNAQYGIVACDANGVLTLFNRALREFHGLPLEPLPAEQWAEHYDLYQRDGKTRMCREEVPLFRALRGEHVHDVEMMVVPKAGRARTFVASGAVLRGKNRERRGAVAVMYDITDRKRAEEALRQSRDQLARLADSLPHSIVYQITHDANGNRRFLYVSAGVNRILGIAPEAIEADASLLYSQIPESFRPMMEEAELASATNQSLFDVEVPSSAADGTLRWLHICSMPHQTEDGQMVWDGIATDITDRKRAEEALRQSEEGLRLVLEASAVGWWSMDLASGALTADDRCKALFGLPPTTELSFALFLERVLPDDRSLAEKHLAEAMVRAADYQGEYRTVWPDDSLHWLFIKGRSFHDTTGKPVFKGIAMDITDRKQAHDEQLQRHQAELAHVARLSVMGEMAASLAHELNQPLHAVTNYASGSLMRLLKTPQQDEELLVALREISAEAKRAAEIIHRVKGFVEKREPQFAEVCASSLIEEVVLLGRGDLEQRCARVVLELADDLPGVVGDAIQIEQVIMNLVRNGLEAMDETPVANRVLRIKTMRHGNEMVEVAVCDCGKGIVGGNLAQVFEPFFTTKPEGMGMGLAICRSIVQAHGGRLWLSTDQPRGCTFHFTLPAGKRS